MSTKKAAGKTAAKSPVKRFRALVNRKEGGDVCSIDIPFDVEKTFGARGRVPVRGTLNGAPFRSSVFRMGGDCHFMVVNRRMREAAGVSGGGAGGRSAAWTGGLARVAEGRSTARAAPARRRAAAGAVRASAGGHRGAPHP